MEEKSSCFVCSVTLSLPDRVDVRKDKTPNRTPFLDVVYQILDKKRVDSGLSLFLCRTCSALVSEWEDLIEKAKSIKVEICQRVYKRVSTQVSGQNREIENGELVDLNYFIDDDIKVFEINVDLKQEGGKGGENSQNVVTLDKKVNKKEVK